MSKNLTRKGLAFGALIALGSSVIAGTPALASNALSVYPTAGLQYGAISSDDFDLSIVIPSTLAVSETGDSVRVAIKALDTKTTSVDFTLSAGNATDETADETDLNDGGAPGDATVKNEIVALQITDNLTNDDLRVFNLDIAAASVVDGKSSFEVKSWIDTDSSGGTAPNGDEVATTRTVTIYDTADLTYNTTFKTPSADVATLSGTVTISEELNLTQVGTDLASDISVGLASISGATYTQRGGATVSGAGAFTAGGSTVSYSSTDGFTWTETLTPTAGVLYAAQLVHNSLEVGTEVRRTATAASIVTDVDIDVTASAVVRDDSADGTDEASTFVVQKDTTSLNLTVSVFKTDISGSGDEVAYAGRKVTVTVADGGLAATSVVTVNGKKLVAAGDALEITGTTNSSGQFVLNITGATGATDDSLDITVDVEGKTLATGDSAPSTATVTWAANSVSSIQALDAVGTGAVLTQAFGSTFALNYGIKDTFNAKYTGTAYRVKLVYDGQDAKYVAFTGGTASVSVTDKNTAADTATVTATLQKVSTDGGSWSDIATNTQTVNLVTTVAATAVTLAATDTTDVALETEKLVSVDTRLDGLTSADYTDVTELSGYVTGASDAVVNGASVTLSANGVLFEASGVHSLGSITVKADTNGYFSGVQVYSRTAGAIVVTATSGAASKTLTVNFAGATTVDADSKLTITVPATAAAGQIVNATVKLVDLNGNPIANKTVTFGSVGIGFLAASSATTDAAGAASVKLIVGALESGSAAISASVVHTADAAKTVAATGSVVVAAPVVAEVAATITGATKKINLTIDNAKGELVQIKVGNKTVKTFTAYAKAHAFGIKAAKGSQAVKVYVAGDLIAAKTVSVK